jgi:hypothetical protein
MARVWYLYPIITPLDYTETRVRETSIRIVYQELRSEMRPVIQVNSIATTGRFELWNSCSVSLSDLPKEFPTELSDSPKALSLTEQFPPQ